MTQSFRFALCNFIISNSSIKRFCIKRSKLRNKVGINIHLVFTDKIVYLFNRNSRKIRFIFCQNIFQFNKKIIFRQYVKNFLEKILLAQFLMHIYTHIHRSLKGEILILLLFNK